MKARIMLPVVLLVASASVAGAQQQGVSLFSSYGPFRPFVRLGGLAAVTVNLHSAGPSVEQGSDSTGAFGTGSGVGYQLGVAFELNLPDLITLDARVFYDARFGSFEQSGGDALVLMPNGAIEVQNPRTDHANVDLRLVTTELLLTARPVSIALGVDLVVATGPSFGVAVASSIERWRTRADQESSGSKLEEPIDGLNRMRWGAIVAVGVDWWGSDALGARARIAYEHGLSDVIRGQGWRMSALSVGVDLLH